MNHYEILAPLLSSINAESLKEFLHRCTDEILGRRGPSEEKCCQSSLWSPTQFRSAVSETKTFLIECIVNNYDRKEIAEKLSLSEDQTSAVIKCITVRRDELQESLVKNVTCGTGHILRDFDWKLKLIMGSSSLSSLHETILELNLVTVNNNVQVPLSKPLQPLEKFPVELSLENVNSLITTLEKAQESLSV